MLTHVVEADSTGEEAMRQLGVADFSTAVVAIGTDPEASILSTGVLVDLGVEKIVAKAVTEPTAASSRASAPTESSFQSATWASGSATASPARSWTTSSPTRASRSSRRWHRELVGKTPADAEVRKRYGVTVVCIKLKGGYFTYATPDTVVQEG